MSCGCAPVGRGHGFALFQAVLAFVVRNGCLLGFRGTAITVTFDNLDEFLRHPRNGGCDLLISCNSLGEFLGNPVKDIGIDPRKFGFQCLENLLLHTCML